MNDKTKVIVNARPIIANLARRYRVIKRTYNAISKLESVSPYVLQSMSAATMEAWNCYKMSKNLYLEIMEEAE